MLKGNVRFSIRHLLRRPGYAAINLLGLAVGFACCLLIARYVQDEGSFHRYHANADRISRVVLDVSVPDGVFNTARTSPPMAQALVREYPEVLDAFRLRKASAVLIDHAEHRAYEDHFFFADPSIFDVLSMPLLEGDARAALAAPFSVVLTPEAARRYFGDQDAVGQSLRLDHKTVFTVTGIMAPAPSQTHFKPAFLASFGSLDALYGERRMQSWGWTGVYTYVLLREESDGGSLEGKLASFVAAHASEDWADNWSLHLQPITSIHLHSHRSGELEPNGDVRSSYFLVLVGAFILLIACFNFVNLTTARSTHRLREVEVRKALGARRRQLIVQFMGEAMLVAGVAYVLAIALAYVSLPVFNGLTQKSLTLNLQHGWTFIAALAALSLTVGAVAGLYPAFLLAGHQPTAAAAHGIASRSKRRRLRQGLVIAQLALSVGLILGTLVVSRQLHFMTRADLGYDDEQLVVVSLQDDERPERIDLLKESLLANPDILNVTAASNVPGEGFDRIVHWPEGMAKQDAPSVPIFFVDAGSVKTMGIEVVAGRDFRNGTDREGGSFLVNETAVRRFGWKDPLGKQIADFEGTPIGQVVGVVKDFHFESMRTAIEPTLMQIRPDWYERIVVRIRPGATSAALAFLKRTWAHVEPSYPFQYTFLEEELAQHYTAEEQLGRAFGYSAALAIVIACLGLFGLATYAAEARTKEIGIRKVVGASSTAIVVLLTRDVLRLLVVAFAIAMPIGYFAMHAWLQHFAYRAALGTGPFVMTGALVGSIALSTVTFPAVKAALTDPVQSLRHE